MKKILALVLAMMMVLTMGVAFAGNYNVTINADSTDKATHTYEAYQIFAGTLDAGETKLSNITWGAGIDTSKLGDLATALNALRDTTAQGYVALTAQSTATDFANAISELNATADSATAQAIAAAFGAALSSTTAGTSGATGVTGLDAGYYLIKDVDDSLADVENGAYTRYILSVVKSVTVNEKASVPSVNKKVKDIDDTTGTETDYQDSADYDIGDDVPFQITATTASKAGDYTKYHITFVDDQSAGLDAPESFSIAVLGQTLTVNNAANATDTKTVGKVKVTAAVVAAGADFQLKVTFENTDNEGKQEGETKEKLGATVNSKPIVVTYTSKLNSSAEIGATGNPNEVYIKYSANPNSDDDSENDEGKTPKDKVIVFTYQPEVTKVKQDGTALDGAGFTLYKKVSAAVTGTTKTGAEIKAELAATDANINVTALEDSANYIVKAMTLKQGSTNVFEFKGIDDGTYVIVETTIPDGYNAFKSETIVVTAVHDEEDDDPQLTELSVDKVLTDADKDTGVLAGNIINQAGATLPETGGVGTTIFYIAGSILVLAAAILLVTKRRMGSDD